MRRILILVVLFVSLSFVLYLIYRYYAVSESSGIKKEVASKECTQNDLIDYYYYENISGSKIKNNKFGLYVYAEVGDFFRLADELVNSNGGDWGYVLIPFNINDRDEAKWRGVFEQLGDRHLISIIQLWDVDPSDYEETTKTAAAFLNSFLWPVKERYVSVYNEPNSAHFWRGEIDPAGYARVLAFTIENFKEENPDFFILNGAFNASAATIQDEYMDSFEYMRLMDREVPGIFVKLDGWASHSYPQPNFSGSPYAEGRSSIKAYASELSFLSSEFGVTRKLPVFITETGWAHAEGENYNNSFMNDSAVAENLKIAYTQVWLKDDRVMAITPFTVKYDPPYDHFSWVNRDNVPYYHYDAVKSLEKTAGTPRKLKTGSTCI